MPAVILDIADSVVDAINGGIPYLGTTAERAYVPVHELKDLATLKVTVVPAELSMVMLDRGRDDFDYLIDVGIQQRSDSIEDSDDLMLLVEEILDLFRGQRLDTDSGSVLCVAAANAPIYAPMMLDEQRVFTSVLRLTFRLARAR